MSRLKSEKLVNAPSPKKRPPIGPGTTAALLVLMYVCGSQYFFKPKVTIERHVEASAGVQLARRPSISQLLSWSDELHLSANQTIILNKLAQDQKSHLAPIESRIKDTMKEFTEFAEKHSSDAVGLTMVQAKAGPISQLGWQKRQLEQGFAEQAFAVLGVNQQHQAVRLQKAETTPKQVRKEANSL